MSAKVTTTAVVRKISPLAYGANTWGVFFEPSNATSPVYTNGMVAMDKLSSDDFQIGDEILVTLEKS